MLQKYISGTTLVKIVESFESAVAEGNLSVGEKLPPVRAVAEDLGVSPATVAGAWRQLKQRGFLETKGRNGTVVANPAAPTFAPPQTQSLEGVIDCATGNPDPKLLPDLGPALASVRRSQTLYTTEPNHPELVELGLRLFRADGIRASGLCVVNGTMDGIERALNEYLYPGDRVAVEDPCFTGVLDLIRSRGLTPVPVKADQSGILPVSLKKALKQNPKALIVTPRAQNPTGAAFTESRTRALKAILKSAPDLFVIEDDYVGEISGAPYHGIAGGKRAKWVILRSLCKAYAPDLRLALMAGDPQTLARIQGRQVLGIRWVSHLLQDIAVHFLKDRKTQQLLKRAGKTYEKRRTSLLAHLDSAGVEASGSSGFNVWIPVDDEAGVAQRLLQAGWMVAPGHRYRIESPSGIRVTVSTLGLNDGKRLAKDLQSCLSPAAFGMGV